MDISDVNLRHLRAIAEIAVTSRVGSAAERVHLSQPAVTQGLLKLEAGLGVKLFDRGNTGMEPTAFGEAFIHRAVRALDQLRLGAEEIQGPTVRTLRKGFAPLDHLITTAQARAIIAVIESGSFTLAGKKLGIEQPTVHRAARDIELLAGVQLFERTSHGITATRAGTSLARRLKLAFVEIRQGMDEVDRLKGSFSGRIVIGSLPLARTYLLPKTVIDVTSAYPELSVGVIDGPYPSLLHLLRHGEVDMVIGALRDPIPTKDVEQETLFSEPVSIIARADHPLTKQRTVSLVDAMRFGWVVAAKGAPTRELFESLLRGMGLPLPSNIIETASLVAARCMLMESDRLTILSRHQILYEEQSGILCALPIELADTTRPIGVTTRVDWHPTAVQSAFLESLRRNAATIATRRGEFLQDAIKSPGILTRPSAPTPA